MLVDTKGGRLRDGGEIQHLIGMATHQTIIQMLPWAARRPDLRKLSQLVAETLQDKNRTAGQMRAIRVTAVSLVGAYLTWFWDPEMMVERPGRHHREDPRPDVAFRLVDGTYLIDEIKTGSIAADLSEYEAQVGLYLEYGGRRWGDSFSGVRLCTLRAPRLAVIFRPDGRKEAVL